MEDQHTNQVSIEDNGARAIRSKWFLVFVSLAIFGLLLFASLPWRFNRFVLEASTRVVEILASSPKTHSIDVNLPKNGEIILLGILADVLPPEFEALGPTPVSVRLVASSANLQGISLPTGGRLIVTTTPDGGTDIGVLNGGSITLALSGVIERIGEDGQRTKIVDTRHAIQLEIRPAVSNSPARIVLPPINGVSIALYNQPVSDFVFRFQRNADEDSLTYQSDILKGKIQILDTSAEINLHPRELILLEGGRRTISRLEVTGGMIEVDVSGEADRISVGPPRPGTPFRLDRDLTPSVLSYLLGQHELKVLWGVTLALLGALWKARQWALKWEK